MKKCTWCGKEYSNEDLRQCLVDGHPLSALQPTEHPTSREPPGTAQRPISRMRAGRETARIEPRYLDLSATDGAFTWQEGYSRPDWAVIRKAIEQSVAAERQSEAWDEAAVQWAQRLRSDLGGD